MSTNKLLGRHLQLPKPDPASGGRVVRRDLDSLSSILNRMRDVVVPETLGRLNELSEKVRRFEMRVCIVGQVKSGKTALTNGLINKPDMLPSDVNPWTTVVTSVHINTPRPRDQGAVFTFFSKDEWDNMITVGGRLGEVAQRADFANERSELETQIAAMQAGAVRRLGKNFKGLLGSAHNFAGFSPKLVKRYVCLGDDEIEPEEGRFADVTKTADLYVDDSRYPMPTVLRDTPGVNDPFLIRETVTIDSLRDSDISVIVLSAHQALSTVDVSLIRILLSLRHEQIVVFINRIDELDDPDTQIEEIDRYVRKTLSDQKLPADIPIIFGSAYWGQAAFYDVAGGHDGDSEKALVSLIDARMKRAAGVADTGIEPNGSTATTRVKTNDLSGLGELQHVLETKAAQIIGMPFVEQKRRYALDLCQQSSALLRQTLESASPLRSDLDVSAFIDQLDEMLKTTNDACHQVTVDLSQQLMTDITAAYRKFLETEIKVLNETLENGGTLDNWKPVTTTLRRELNQSYQTFTKLGAESISELYSDTANVVSRFYALILDTEKQLFAVYPPAVADARVPTRLMETMIIDLASGWLASWFTKKISNTIFIKRFEAIVTGEMDALIKDIQDTYMADFVKTARMRLFDFLVTHIETLQNLSALDEPSQKAEMQRKVGLSTEIDRRLDALAELSAELAGGSGRSCASIDLNNDAISYEIAD